MEKPELDSLKAWIDDPERDYDAGVRLYSKYGKNRNLMRFFDRKTARKGMVTLLYNIEKLCSHKFIAEKKERTDEELKDLFTGGATEGFDDSECERLIALFELKPKSNDKADILAVIANGPLQTGAENENKEPSSQKQEKGGRLRIKKNPNIDYNLLPDNLKVLFDENGKLESDKKSKHALMTALSEDSANDEDRKCYANELCDIEAKQAENWKVIDAWYADKDKEPSSEEKLDPVQKALKEAEEKAKHIKSLKEKASRRWSSLKNLTENDEGYADLKAEFDDFTKQLKDLGADYSPRGSKK